jgi:uncharacterized membrane protein
MAHVAGWARALTFLAMLIGYQVVLHWVAAVRPGSMLAAVAAVLPLAGGGLWMAAHSRRKRLWWGASAALLAGASLAPLYRGGSVEALQGIPHAAIHLALLWVFARTLRPGREALITGFARRFHGALPPEIERYTRNATWVWCAYFASSLAVSAILYRFASFATWSLFVNVLSIPLLVLMFAVEYVYRIARYRNFAHASIWKGIQLFFERGVSASKAAQAR